MTSAAIIRHSLALALLVILWTNASASLAAPAPRALDVVMALDNSGSMRKNDKDALMSKAVAAFAGRLPADAQLGIVIFDQSVRVPQGLTNVGTPDFSARVAQSLRGIDYRGQWTDIPGAVERALYELRTHGRPGALQILILFTDGVVETGNSTKDAERTRWLQESLAAEARERGVRLFGVAFTEGADFQLMQSLAQATGGEHYRVLTPADIDGTFASVLMRVEELNRPAPAATESRVAVPSSPAQRPAPATPTSMLQDWRHWAWIPGVLLALVIAVVAVAMRRKLPAVRLRDIGGHSGQAEIKLSKTLTRIGRNPEGNDIVLAHEEVSSRHAVIEFRNGAFYLRDLRSSNGTFLNGRQVSSPQEIREVPIKHRDRIRLDACEFEFIVDGEVAMGRTVLAAGAGEPRHGTRLRLKAEVGAPQPGNAEAAGLGAGVPAKAKQAAPPAGTLYKTGFCYRHESFSAIAGCSKCQHELCADCATTVDGLTLCPDCRPAVA